MRIFSSDIIFILFLFIFLYFKGSLFTERSTEQFNYSSFCGEFILYFDDFDGT